MESSLHRSLKAMYGTLRGGRCEVAVEGYRIDAVDADGTLIEVQSGGLASLVPKMRSLLPLHRLRVIRPVVVRRIVVRRDRALGPDLSRRRSPRIGSLTDVFDDLVGLASFLPDPNLGVEILGVNVEEVRVPRRRRPGYAVVDRRLAEIVSSSHLREPIDLWNLLPPGFFPGDQFTTADLARKLGRPLFFAQRVAYCLRVAGAAEAVGKRGNSLIYRTAGDVATAT